LKRRIPHTYTYKLYIGFKYKERGKKKGRIAFYEKEMAGA